MSSKIYSPPTNIFELLPQEETFEEVARAKAAKAPVKKDNQPGSTKKMTPAERAQKLKEKQDAEKKRADEEKKMIAEALRREEADQANKEGFSLVGASTTAASPLSKFSRQKYESLRNQGIPIAEIEEMERKEFESAKASAQVPQSNQNKSTQHSNQTWDNRGDNQRQNQNYQGKRQDSNPTAFQGKPQHNQNQGQGNKPSKQKNPGTVFRQEQDNSANRDLDKQSQGKYSRKPTAKKGGEGKGNWGNDIKDQTYADWNNPQTQKSTGGDGWDSTPSSPVPGNKTKDTQKSTATQKESQATPVKDSQTTKHEEKKDVEANVSKAPITPDPDDEGFGKKTLAEYAIEKEKKEAALQLKLKETLGKVEAPRTETEKNFDLSKCIENDKQDKKLLKTAGPKGKPKQTKEDKPKVVHINDFIDKDAVLVAKRAAPNQKSQTRAAPTDRNFPVLGDQPKKQYPQQRPQNQKQNQQGSSAGQTQGTAGQNQQQGSRQNQGQQTSGQGQRQQGSEQNKTQ